ncbi:transposase [Vibrio cholerae]|nr:transposase [Vibrio cholerae]
MIKCIFSILLRTLQRFIGSVFMLAQVLLKYAHCTYISRRAEQVEISFKPRTS